VSGELQDSQHIKLPNGVDSAVFDPTSQYYYVASGGEESEKTHALSIIDTKTFKQIGEIALPGTNLKPWPSTKKQEDVRQSSRTNESA